MHVFRIVHSRYFILPGVKDVLRKTGRRAVYQDILTDYSLQKTGSAKLENQLLTQLKCETVVVPRSVHLDIVHDKFKCSIKAHHIYNHIREDWYLMKETTIRIYPEYANVWETFEDTERMYCCNMFIADKAFINNYCSWLFTMSELEQMIKITDYRYQKRIFGFIAERLIDLYLLNNNVNVAQRRVLELK